MRDTSLNGDTARLHGKKAFGRGPGLLMMGR